MNRAAAGGEYEAASPMTLAPVSAPEPPALPAARPRWRSAAAIEALSPASLRPRIEMPTWVHQQHPGALDDGGIE